jgi:hypothetical protein
MSSDNTTDKLNSNYNEKAYEGDDESMVSDDTSVSRENHNCTCNFDNFSFDFCAQCKYCQERLHPAKPTCFFKAFPDLKGEGLYSCGCSDCTRVLYYQLVKNDGPLCFF